MNYIFKAAAQAVCAAVLGGAFGTVCVFTAAEAKASKGNIKKEADFLLILGCRVRGEKAEETLQMRIEAAAKFLSEHKNTKAICCGGIVHSDQTKSEAQVIYEGLVSLGIEKERIILEDKSTTTEENFINAKKIIEKITGGEKAEIAFISSEFHLLRAGIIAEKAEVKASSVAAPSPKKQKFKNYARELIVFPAVYFKKQEK